MVKDLASSLLWLGFDPWPGEICMPWDAGRGGLLNVLNNLSIIPGKKDRGGYAISVLVSHAAPSLPGCVTSVPQPSKPQVDHLQSKANHMHHPVILKIK